MITSLILFMMIAFIRLGVAVLPIGSLPTQVGDAFETAFGYLAGWNGIFPIDTLLTVVGYSLTFQAVVWGWELLNWVYGRIRGVSAK